jgi:chromosome segregation protein
LRAPPKGQLPPDAIGWLSDLLRYDDRYSAVIEYMFGRTACVENIDKAKQIGKTHRLRMVTLDGDLVEPSGAMTGGFFKRKKSVSTEIDKYSKERQTLQDEINAFEKRLSEINGELKFLSAKLGKKKKPNIVVKKSKIDTSLRKLREKRREKYEQMLALQQEVGKLNIRKAKLETKIDNLGSQIEGVKEENLKPFNTYKVSELRNKERQALERMQTMGSINLKSLEDFETIKTEFDEFREKFDKIVSERDSILETMRKIDEKRTETFMHTFKEIAAHFQKVYAELTKGTATLELEDPTTIDSGLLIKASPAGKKLLHIDSMSGGEKTLTAFAFLFAIQRHKPTPFYILDEADATLDKKNAERVAQLIRRHSQAVQFIAISHNDIVIKEAHQIYGVSMQDGESKIFGIKLPEN